MNRQPKLLGLDLGFGFTKCTDGAQPVIFQSHMYRATESGITPDHSAAGIHRIEMDGEAYVVGHDRAGLSPFEDFPRQPERLINDYGHHLILTALATYSDQEIPLYVVVGLPIAYFRRWETRLVENLSGYHKIGVRDPADRYARKNIHVRKLHVVPHPLGAFTSLIMDHEGRFRSSEYDAIKIALVDIGFRTTDVMIMDATRFCHRGSETFQQGLVNAFASIARRLDQETGQMPRLEQLYKAIHRGFIRVGDQEYNLKNLREETFHHLSSALADRINYALKDDWDIERVVLTGGGAVEIAEHLAPLVNGEVVLIEHDQDARLGNAQGQLSLARHMWGASGLCERNGQ